MTKKSAKEAEIEFTTIGQQVVRTAVWKGNGQQRPLLFFNGIGAYLELAAPLGEGLEDRDVVAFDIPGTGGSENPKLPYRPWQIARMAARILDHYDYGDVDVLGVSWGGDMAQQFAFQYRKRVKKLILAATSAGWTMIPGKPEALSKMANPRRYADPEYMKKNFQKLYGEEPDGSAKSHRFAIKPPSRKGYLFQMMAMAGWLSLPFLLLLPQPTLILAGDKDSIVPVANARILHTFIRKSQLHVVKGSGHLFIVSRADEIIPLIRDFLNRDETAESPTKPTFSPAAE
jgi:poly(3-hydroxyalkanoate) depolymerase